MIKVYSKKKKMLLHMIFRKKDFTAKRQNICDEKEFLQISPLTLGLNQTFKPHIHKWNYTKINKRIAQESWIVIRGKVKAFYYDLDQKFLCSKIINEGDITVTFRGGHNYKSLSKNSMVYEFKTGPYESMEKDKKLIK
jgi:hypothetical protein